MNSQFVQISLTSGNRVDILTTFLKVKQICAILYKNSQGKVFSSSWLRRSAL